jgi:hypothetical protein
VKRGQVDTFYEGLDNSGSDADTALEFLAGMNDTVPESINFIDIFYTPVFFAGEYTQEIFDPGLMVKDFSFQFHFDAVAALVFDQRAFQADFVDQAFGEHLLGGHFEELIFYG